MKYEVTIAIKRKEGYTSLMYYTVEADDISTAKDTALSSSELDFPELEKTVSWVRKIDDGS